VNLLAGYLGDDEPSIRPLPRRVRCQPTADAIFAHVGQNLRSTNASGALGSLTRQRPISGGIRGTDLRARENVCEAGGLTQGYRDRCPAVGHPMPLPPVHIGEPEEFEWLLAHPFSPVLHSTRVQ
jgi:hypothetical protein